MKEVYIIAEIASAHEGDPKHASHLIQLASKTGADAIKLQIFQREHLVSRFHPKYDIFGQIEISQQDWRWLLQEAAASGADVIIEPYDEESLIFAESMSGITGYKIPTSDVGNMSLLNRAAATGKTIYLGVGGANEDEIRAALSVLSAGDGEVVLMHGFQAFPTPLEKSQLTKISWLRDTFNTRVGYADHVDADDTEMARLLPALAIAVGATVIEKHITDDRSRKGIDHHSSFNPDEFASLVPMLRQIPAIMGLMDRSELSDKEAEYRYLMKRQAVAARDISAGESLQPALVTYKRTNRRGLSPQEIANLKGRRIDRALEEDEPIALDDLT